MLSTTYISCVVFFSFVYFILLIFFQFPSLCFHLFAIPCLFLFLLVSSLCLLIHPNRSRSADSGSMCMMNWAGTPAAQVLPRVHGDTTRGELLCSAVTHGTLLLFMHTWNSLHRLRGLNSPTSASNMISQWFIQHQDTTRQILILFRGNQCTYTYLQNSVCKSGIVCKSVLTVSINSVKKCLPYGPKLICDEMSFISTILSGLID